MALLACAQGRTLLQNDDSNGADQSSIPPPPPMNVTSPPPPPPPTSAPPPPTPPSPSSTEEQTTDLDQSGQDQSQTDTQGIVFQAPIQEGGNQEEESSQQQQEQQQTITSPAPSPEDFGGGTVSPQLQDEESDIIDNLPSDIVPDGTSVDTAVVQDVNSSLQQNENDPSSGAEALNSALSSATAVSVSKGFSTAVVSNPSAASAYTNSFAQLCINAANSGDVTYVTKTVSSFSLSIVFLVVTGNVAVARTCASAFTTYIISAGGCSEFVVIIIQTFIQITVSLTSRTTVNIFG